MDPTDPTDLNLVPNLTRSRPFHGPIPFFPGTLPGLLALLILFLPALTGFTPTPVPVETSPAAATPAAKPLKITAIPNPARGKRVTFRVMSQAPCRVRLQITDRFFDPIAKIDKEGNGLFDILWSLQKVPEGIYYYQAQVEDKGTGQFTKVPLQKFVVLK